MERRRRFRECGERTDHHIVRDESQARETRLVFGRLLRGGKSIDTSMAFYADGGGLLMGTRLGRSRSWGWFRFFARTEGMTAEQIHRMVNRESGLFGVSETSSDMRDLLDARKNGRASSRGDGGLLLRGEKRIGAFTAALGGWKHLYFRAESARTCGGDSRTDLWGLTFLGVELDAKKMPGTRR